MARRERRAQMSFGSLKDSIQDKGGFKDDERIFKLKPKEDGTGTAIIRFLPAPDSEVPFVNIYEHGFKGDNGYYIEACPTTIGKDCPACKQNNIYWNNDQEDEARARKRKQSFYANILVIKDDNCPEREGKVFLFRYGKKIHDKIVEAIEGTGGEEPFNPFDYYEGANFVLNQKQVGGFNNYDSSRFKDPTPISKDEKEIDAIDEQLFDIKPFVSDDKFKAYSVLAALYKAKTGITPPTVDGESVPEENATSENDEADESTSSVDISKDEAADDSGTTGARSKIFEKLKNRNKDG
jgi:hypothetical protein